MAKKEKTAEETSLAGRAWNATKGENDPEWAAIPNAGFKNDLEFAAERVKTTGTAQTNFEIAVKEFAAEDAKNEDAPMAKVAPQAAVDASAPMAIAAPDLPATTTAPVSPRVKTAVKKSVKKSTAKAKASKATAAKTDKSGHVATGKEAAAAKKDAETAPLNP